MKKYPMMQPPENNDTKKEDFTENEILGTDGTWLKKEGFFDTWFSDVRELPRPEHDEYRYFLGWCDGIVRIKRVKKE